MTDETEYLMKDPANAKRLLESMKEARGLTIAQSEEKLLNSISINKEELNIDKFNISYSPSWDFQQLQGVLIFHLFKEVMELRKLIEDKS
jgi:hypothetical protein